jgi:hypothetical protein
MPICQSYSEDSGRRGRAETRAALPSQSHYESILLVNRSIG